MIALLNEVKDCLVKKRSEVEVVSQNALDSLQSGLLYQKNADWLDQMEITNIENIQTGNFSNGLLGYISHLGLSLPFGKSSTYYHNIEKNFRSVINNDYNDSFLIKQWQSLNNRMEALISGAYGEIKIQDGDQFTPSLLLDAWYCVLYEKPGLDVYLQNLKKDDKCMGSIIIIDTLVLNVMYLISISRKASDENKKEVNIKLDEMIKVIGWYTDVEPRAFQCKKFLAMAEISVFRNETSKAILYYEQSIQHSKQNSYKFYEGIALERYGLFLSACKFDILSKFCLQTCYSVWISWGSVGKCKMLESKYFQIFNTEFLQKNRQTPSITAAEQYKTFREEKFKTEIANKDHYDMTAIMQVFQMLQNETSLDIILSKIMKYVMMTAGATKGVLILESAGSLYIDGISLLKDGVENISVLQSIPLKPEFCGKIVPISIINFVYRAKEPLVISNPHLEPLHSSDHYLIAEQPKSVLCCPIEHHSATSGLLYLENSIQAGAFHQERIEIIKAIMPSASMSIENAKLIKTNNILTAALKESETGSQAPQYNLDAPVQKAIETLQSLRARVVANGDANSIKQIDFLIQTILSSDLFSSSMENINDGKGRGIDLETKHWIENSLLQKTPKPSARRNSLYGAIGSDKSIALVEETTPYSITGPILGASINQEVVDSLLQNSLSGEMDVFKLNEATNGNALFYLSIFLMNHNGIISSLNINEAIARSFFMKVEQGYHNHPYHNRYISHHIIPIWKY
jgi:GAF domain-containing protein